MRPPTVMHAAMALLLMAGLAAPLDARALGMEDCRQLVYEAQSVFETGYALHEQGHKEMALQMFEKSHALLLKADRNGDMRLHQRLENVFEIYYDLLSPIVPDTVQQLRIMRRQIKSTFRESAVHEGHVRAHINDLVRNKRGFLINSFRKSHKYIPMIKKEFTRQGLPTDLAYMALIESGFNPRALSHAGAKGIWQFMPETARRFGLKVTDTLDERTDPIKSTKAAARYLTTLYRQFGNWPLAVAAYNCGEGRVARAMKKHRANTFWELVQKKALPGETQRYVPSIIAVTIISRDFERYNLPSM